MAQTLAALAMPQALLRVTRPRAPEGSDEFELDDLLPVQFSNLVRPAGDDDDDDDGEYDDDYGDDDGYYYDDDDDDDDYYEYYDGDDEYDS